MSLRIFIAIVKGCVLCDISLSQKSTLFLFHILDVFIYKLI
jgi:hypothetical protein